jgi:hypothetical protein
MRIGTMSRSPVVCLVAFGLALAAAVESPRWRVGLVSVGAGAEPEKQLDDKFKEIAGTAEFLRSVPKRFATLKAVDPARRQVTLLIEGENLDKVWPVTADAEIKVAGWWGRLDQLTVGDRVWAWFKWDRNKQPVAVTMLADELSEQDIHGAGVTVTARDGDTLTFESAGGKRTVRTAGATWLRGKDKADLAGLKKDERVYVQSSGERARLILDLAAFAVRRAEQQAELRKRWISEGLPGTVTFLHPFSGEMDYTLDHEAMRWGRSLKPGDKVTLQADPPIPAVVKQVRPWREHTQLRLVVHGVDQADLSLGQRLALRMDAPPASVDTSSLPPDIDRPRGKEERLEWFLASMYCTCKVRKDVCTGHFYTLASCNPNGCGMPNQVRKIIAEKIDKGLSDRQIWEDLLKEQGPDMLRPHLLP